MKISPGRDAARGHRTGANRKPHATAKTGADFDIHERTGNFVPKRWCFVACDGKKSFGDVMPWKEVFGRVPKRESGTQMLGTSMNPFGKKPQLDFIGRKRKVRIPYLAILEKRHAR